MVQAAERVFTELNADDGARLLPSEAGALGLLR